MNRSLTARRRSPPLIVVVLAAVLVCAALVAALFGLVAWREAQQIEMLRGEIQALQDERQEMEGQFVALSGTATAMENRLVTLEDNDPAQQLAAIQARLATANGSEQVAELRTSLIEIQDRVNAFQSTLDGLSARIEALEPTGGTGGAERLPAQARLSVPRQQQSHNLSCESSAASMVAQYYGLDLSEAEVMAALPLNDNPHLGFRGNVDGPTGGIEDYGVYAGPILSVLQDQGLRAWLVGGGLTGIKAAIARGNPVIAWVTYNCLPSTVVEAVIDGQAVNLVPNQHVVVVTGYNADGIWANDPWDGQEDFYSNDEFVQAMGYFDNMAIEVASP